MVTKKHHLISAQKLRPSLVTKHLQLKPWASDELETQNSVNTKPLFAYNLGTFSVASDKFSWNPTKNISSQEIIQRAPLEQENKTTEVDLYRLGNASSPRMDHVRDKDIATYENDGELWVSSGTGGISTFSAMPTGKKNCWTLDAGTEIPPALNVINDRGNHWSWEPEENMPMVRYKTNLQLIGQSFEKIS